jgi:hypothetical protein
VRGAGKLNRNRDAAARPDTFVIRQPDIQNKAFMGEISPNRMDSTQHDLSEFLRAKKMDGDSQPGSVLPCDYERNNQAESSRNLVQKLRLSAV